MDPVKHIIEEESSKISLSFLIEILNRDNHIYLIHEMNNLGITYHEYQLLFYLYHEKTLIQEDFARHFRKNESSITRALKKLEDRDIIKREQDESNRRKNIVFLTKKGIELAEKVQELDKKWEKEILISFSPKDKRKLKKALKKLAVNSFKKEKK